MKKKRRLARWCAPVTPGRWPADARFACPPWSANEPQNGFLRGAIAAGLLASLAPEVGRQEALRRALQGGAAMAAGIAGADAIDRRDYGAALLALAAGAAGLKAIDVLLSNSQTNQEDSNDE